MTLTQVRAWPLSMCVREEMAAALVMSCNWECGICSEHLVSEDTWSANVIRGTC